MHRILPLFFIIWALNTAAFGDGRIIITEIMYNPNSNERGGATEWVEIANVGDKSVNLRNWRLDDEDRAGWGAFSITLRPGKVAVLINARYITAEAFRAAWDKPRPIKRVDTPNGAPGPDSEPAQKPDAAPPIPTNYTVIPVKWGSIANTPTEENEILQLLDSDNRIVCEVNLRHDVDWPRCNRPDGSSIYLADLTAKDLNKGVLWKRSEPGRDGARQNVITPCFDGDDTGSPGFVFGLHKSIPTEKKAAEKSADNSVPPPATSDSGDHTENNDDDDDDVIDF